MRKSFRVVGSLISIAAFFSPKKAHTESRSVVAVNQHTRALHKKEPKLSIPDKKLLSARKDKSQCIDNNVTVRSDRAKERDRIALIMSHPNALSQQELALHYALKTNLPAAEAIKALEFVPKSSAGSYLEQVMERYKDQRAGIDILPGNYKEAVTAARWDKAISAAANDPEPRTSNKP